jgi:hypothetical protein
MAYLLTQLGGQDGSSPVRGTASAPKPAAAATTATPVETTASAAQVPEQPGTSGRGHKNLEKFVSSYYSDVTKDTDRTWDQLSPSMQNFAGGRDGYDSFWKTIDKVRVNEIQVNDSGQSAVSNLTFTRDDGTASTETHQLTFVTHDGDYLIESDQLLR